MFDSTVCYAVAMKYSCSALLLALALAPAAFSQTSYTYVSVDYPSAGYTQLNGITPLATSWAFTARTLPEALFKGFWCKRFCGEG